LLYLSSVVRMGHRCRRLALGRTSMCMCQRDPRDNIHFAMRREIKVAIESPCFVIPTLEEGLLAFTIKS